jgi:uncharacterized protein YndB with AHSA1/START domain
MKASDDTIVVKQAFKASLDTVWRSITELDQMRRWYFENIPSFKPEVGFETSFNVQSGGRDFMHLWKVTEVVPLKRLSYDWKYEGYPGDSFVVFELSERGGATTLRLTVTVRKDFPDDIPEFKRESCIVGWQYFIKDRLKRYVEGSVSGS